MSESPPPPLTVNLETLEIVLPDILIQTIALIGGDSKVDFTSKSAPGLNVEISKASAGTVRLIINKAQFIVIDSGLRCVLTDENFQSDHVLNSTEDSHEEAASLTEIQNPTKCIPKRLRNANVRNLDSNAVNGVEVDEESEFTCEKCDESFSYIDEYQQHVEHCCVSNGQEMEPNKFMHCDKTFADALKLKSHISKLHPDSSDSSLTCKICRKQFRLKRLLNEHVKRVHPVTRIPCERCPATFKTRFYLREHVRAVHEEKRLDVACPQCDKRFNSKGVLARHRKFHDAAKKVFSCTDCGKSFHLRYNLQRHIRLLHDADRRASVVCDTCGKKFSSESNLRQHTKQVHLKEFPFSCRICDKGFLRRKDCEIHLRVHRIHFEKANSSKKPIGTDSSDNASAVVKFGETKSLIYACGNCAAEFENGAALDVHLRECRVDWSIDKMRAAQALTTLEEKCLESTGLSHNDNQPVPLSKLVEEVLIEDAHGILTSVSLFKDSGIV